MEAMVQEWTDGRLDDFDRKVDQRFDRVEAELGAMRFEMRSEFTAVRGEIAGLRTELAGEIEGVRGEIAGLRKEVAGEIAGVRGETSGLRKDVAGEFANVRGEIAGVRDEVAEMRRVMTQGLLGLAGVMVTGFVGVLTLIVIAQF